MGNISIPLSDGWRFIKADDPSVGAELTMQATSDLLDKVNSGEDPAPSGPNAAGKMPALPGGPSGPNSAPHFEWAQPSFDDSAWREVRVPHDWGVESPFDSDRRYGDAFLDVSGVGWYRIKLRIENGELKIGGRSVVVPEDGKVYFECDGAMSYAMAFVNGTFAGGWPYGYTRWRIDLTRQIGGTGNGERGTGNNRQTVKPSNRQTDVTLAIRCHNVPDSSRWYTGGGLFRECRLLVCPNDHVVPGSVFITTPEVTPEQATVQVRYEMSVSGAKERVFTVDKPHLWDIDDPYLYTIDIEGNAYRYGIRTIAFHADERRFQLNGRTVPLNGVSMHHDFGVLGAAWNRAAQKRRLQLFKEAGVNAIRSSHNPPDEGLLELCDELGLLVKDEVFDEWRKIGAANKRKNGYTNLFDKWHERDVRAWVRTDRNHPCVIMYSVGNEICEGFDTIAPLSEFAETARHLARLVAEEDPTRPATNANNNRVNFTNEYPSVLPLMGCNYYSWEYQALKQAHPDVPFFGSETICMSSTRGEYHFPVSQKWKDACGECGENFHNSSYCWEAVGWEKIDGNWACPPDAQWYWMDAVKTCMGEFIWTGVDYLGGPFWCDDWRKKPNFTDPQAQERALAEVNERGLTRAAIHTCNTGFLDQAGFRKDAFWLFQSRWRPDFPMAHILPHWNWEGREGEVTPVHVFTSGDEGELFLNGRSLGRRRKEPGVWDRAYRLRWDEVRYEPGVLEVVVYKDGAEWARDRVETTGAPAKLVIEPESDTVLSDGQDIAYANVSVRDAAGRIVPRASNRIEFAIEGPGTIIATDNGDETDFDDFRLPSRKAFNGWCQALVRAKAGESGEIRITATASGLEPATAVVSASLQ